MESKFHPFLPVRLSHPPSRLRREDMNVPLGHKFFFCVNNWRVRMSPAGGGRGWNLIPLWLPVRLWREGAGGGNFPANRPAKLFVLHN